MAFNGTEGTFIDLNEASDMTAAWRNGNNGSIKAVFYGKDKLNDILAQEGCVGIRMYFAENEDGEKTLVLVGAESNENDMDEGKVLEFGIPCPDRCGASNDLNS